MLSKFVFRVYIGESCEWRLINHESNFVYRICVAVFSSFPVALHVYLNGEPIYTLQPESSSNSTAVSAQGLREEKYILRRLKHSLGDVTCVTIDEHVSLPTDSALSIRFHSQVASAQAFLSIRKL